MPFVCGNLNRVQYYCGNMSQLLYLQSQCMHIIMATIFKSKMDAQFAYSLIHVIGVNVDW